MRISTTKKKISKHSFFYNNYKKEIYVKTFFYHKFLFIIFIYKVYIQTLYNPNPVIDSSWI